MLLFIFAKGILPVISVSSITDKILTIVKECPRGQTLAGMASGRNPCSGIYGCYLLSYKKRG